MRTFESSSINAHVCQMWNRTFRTTRLRHVVAEPKKNSPISFFHFVNIWQWIRTEKLVNSFNFHGFSTALSVFGIQWPWTWPLEFFEARALSGLSRNQKKIWQFHFSTSSTFAHWIRIEKLMNFRPPKVFLGSNDLEPDSSNFPDLSHEKNKRFK